MAIKGKKKSQNRGSQARRRPAPAPRPVVASRTKRAWYRSQTGIALLGILAIIAIGVTVVLIQNTQEAAAELDKRQEALDSYTNEIKTVLQTLRPAAGAMAAAPPALEDDKQATELEDSAAGWSKAIEQAQTSFAEVAPPGPLLELEPSVQNINNLYAQSIGIYLSAARTYELAATTDPKSQADALAAATTQRGQASAVWTEATALLDKRRAGADIDPSGLTAPDAAAPSGAPPGDLPTGFPTEGQPPEGEVPPPGQAPPGNGGGGGNGEGNGGGG